MVHEACAQPGASPVRLAIFDLDGTLIVGDSLLGFVRLVLQRAPRTLLRIPVIAGRLTRSVGRARGVKEAMLSVIDPLTRTEQAALVDEFVEHVAATRVRPEVARLRDEQAAAGRVPVVVSASPDLYVAPLAARLGFPTAVATRLVRRGDGGASSRIAGDNMKGWAKLRALSSHFDGRGIDWSGSFACGDRSSDRAVLDRVGEPVVVHPDALLRVHARTQGWRILS